VSPVLIERTRRRARTWSKLQVRETLAGSAPFNSETAEGGGMYIGIGTVLAIALVVVVLIYVF
jgi:hypothetical protein